MHQFEYVSKSEWDPVKQELLDSTLRFSFGMFNKKEEIDYAIEVLKELLPVLRRYRRG